MQIKVHRTGRIEDEAGVRRVILTTFAIPVYAKRAMDAVSAQEMLTNQPLRVSTMHGPYVREQKASLADNVAVRNGVQKMLAARTHTVWIGFAGLLGLMVFIAVDSGSMLRSVAATSATLRQESRARDALLDQLRNAFTNRARLYGTIFWKSKTRARTGRRRI